MSSILLSNPFVAHPPSQTTVAAMGEILSSFAVAPMQRSTGAAISGSGFGSSDRHPSPDFSRRSVNDTPPQNPSDATRNSVVMAQTQSEALRFPDSSLPKVEMPDPLPTSPLLLALRQAD